MPILINLLHSKLHPLHYDNLLIHLVMVIQNNLYLTNL